MNELDMTGKVVLITGGSRGLGKAMAHGFARNGADIAIVSRKLDSCIETAKEIESYGVKAFHSRRMRRTGPVLMQWLMLSTRSSVGSMC